MGTFTCTQTPKLKLLLKSTDGLSYRLVFPHFFSLNLVLTSLCLMLLSTSMHGQGNCLADAGSIDPDCSSGEFCEYSGDVDISASHSSNPVVPQGYIVRYFLTQGGRKTLVDIETQAEFNVSQSTSYGIHSLVYNNNPSSSNYLDLSGIVLGNSTLNDLSAVINAQGVCADLDLTGASIKVKKCLIPFLARVRDDFVNTLANVSAEGNVLLNDRIVAGNPFTLTRVSGPFNGTVNLNDNGEFLYTPNPGFTGKDEFTYELCDQGICPARCILATTYIEVFEPVLGNNPPIANLDAICVQEGRITVIDVRANDIDPDGDNLQNPTPHKAPNRGTVSYNSDGTVTYRPNAGFTGYDLFEYKVCDDANPSLCAFGLVTVRSKPNLSNGNPPIPMDDAIVMPKNTSRLGETVIENDFEIDGDPITYSILEHPSHGNVVFRSDGGYDYTPDTDYIGPDHFVYTMTDKDGSANATVRITVHGLGASFPVEWLGFRASIQGQQARLDWSTGLEINSSHFDIERSLSQGQDFEKIGEVSAQGFSEEAQTYQFLDPGVFNLGAEKIYYRLRQVDLDGAYDYSRVFELDLGNVPRTRLLLSPNPAQQQVEIVWSSTEEIYQIRMFDAMGKIVFDWNPQVPTRFGSFIQDLENIGSGIYIIQSFSDNTRNSMKLQVD